MINPNNHPAAAIESALRAHNGVQNISFRYDLLDRDGIKIGELDGIERGWVSWNEFRTIERTAAFDLTETGLRRVREINYLSDQIQPWFILHIDGGTVEWPLGIFMLESPERTVTGPVKRRSIGAYDRTLILDQYRLKHRQYFPAGTGYTAAIEQLIGMAGIRNTAIEASPLSLGADKEFPIGTSALEAVNDLLTAVNYTSLSVDSMGYVRSGPFTPPAQRPVTKIYEAGKQSVMAPGFTDSIDLANRANVFVLTCDDLEGGRPLVSIFRNDDPSSPLSTVNRGREIVDHRTVSEAADQETLDAMAYRTALENSAPYRHIKFNTLLQPAHGAAEVLYLDIPGVLDAPGKYIETAWEMDLSVGGLMSHDSRMAVDIVRISN